MERHYVYFAVIAIMLSAAFAQQITDPADQAGSQSPFDKYCYTNCIALANDSRCADLCTSNNEAFGSFCSDVCLAKGGNSNLCTMGCALLVKKRADMKSCFDSCSASNSDIACDNDCNVTSTVKTIMTTVGLATTGEMNATKAGIIERRIADLFPNSTVATSLGKEILVREGRMNFTDVDGKRYIRLPIGLENNEKLDSLVDRLTNVTIINDTVYIPIRSRIGPTVASIVAETNGIRGKDGIGEGEITSIKLKTEAVPVALATASDRIVKPSEVTVDADLNDIPDSAALDVKDTSVPAGKLERFKIIARGMNLTINETPIAIEITKENLQNKADVARARIRMKVDKAWVMQDVGGVVNLRIMREDNGNYEMLDTSLVGEEGGMLIIEGDSPNGLSLYAMVTVGVTAPTGDTGKVVVSPGSGGGINPILIGAILLVVVAAVYLFVLKKK
ncbi:Uncharacterised protein [uncultured archaeon]|nr:Uncharacterised protein [uncultured archaeon]